MARRRRGFKSRGTFGKRKRSRSRIARNRKRLRTIARSIVPESKFLITNVAQTAVPMPAGQLYILNAMAQGNDASTRIGNKITCTGLSIKGFHLAAGASSQVVRCILFKWYDSVAPSLSSVLQSSSISSPYFVAAQPKFRVMKDIMINMSPAGQEGAVKTFKMNFKLKTLTSFTGPNAADWLNGVIYLLVLSTTNNSTDVKLDAVLRYQDA